MIIDQLSDDLLSPKFKKLKAADKGLPNTFGHCYVASEAAYYLLGGKEEGWKPCFMIHESKGHWYLQHKSGFILDLTKNQFIIPPDYSLGKGKGFLTNKPCSRTNKLFSRINNNLHLYKL